MSEQGWREFLAAEGVEDWVVMHGGATAVFSVSSLAEAAQVAEVVAHIPGVEGSGVLMTIAGDRLSVRLSRDLWHLDERPHRRRRQRPCGLDPLGPRREPRVHRRLAGRVHPVCAC